MQEGKWINESHEDSVMRKTDDDDDDMGKWRKEGRRKKVGPREK